MQVRARERQLTENQLITIIKALVEAVNSRELDKTLVQLNAFWHWFERRIKPDNNKGFEYYFNLLEDYVNLTRGFEIAGAENDSEAVIEFFEAIISAADSLHFDIPGDPIYEDFISAHLCVIFLVEGNGWKNKTTLSKTNGEVSKGHSAYYGSIESKTRARLTFRSNALIEYNLARKKIRETSTNIKNPRFTRFDDSILAISTMANMLGDRMRLMKGDYPDLYLRYQQLYREILKLFQKVRCKKLDRMLHVDGSMKTEIHVPKDIRVPDSIDFLEVARILIDHPRINRVVCGSDVNLEDSHVSELIKILSQNKTLKLLDLRECTLSVEVAHEILICCARQQPVIGIQLNTEGISDKKEKVATDQLLKRIALLTQPNSSKTPAHCVSDEVVPVQNNMLS